MSVSIGIDIQRSPNRINQALRAAGVNGQYPKLLFDFNDEYYLTRGSSKTFADAMTFARAGNATMVDSDGLIKWAPHNKLPYSQEFDNGTWAKTNVTVTANATTAPDGSLTADLITPDVGNYNRFVQSNSASITGEYVSYYIWAKPNGAQWVRLTIKNTSTHCVWFDLDAGTKGTENGVVSSSITAGSDGWYLLGITVSSAGSDGVIFGITNANNGTTYNGDDSKQVYVWGAHVYRSDLGGMVNNPDRGDSYVPTTSAVYLPRRGHHKYNGDQWVNKGILVESEARTNLEIDSASPPVGASITGVTYATGGEDPIGGTSGVEIRATTATSAHFLGFSNSVVTYTSGQKYTTSFFVKARGAQRYLSFAYSGTKFATPGRRAAFDLVSGLATQTETGVTATIEPFGGFYRVSVTATATSTGTDTNSYFIGLNDSDSLTATTYTGNVNNGVDLWGAQVEVGSTVSSYIPTNGATVTRAAETVTVPYANLPWPTPTYIGDELVTNGTFDTDTSGWTAGDSGSLLSVSSGVFRLTNNDATPAYANQSISIEVGKVYEITFDVVARTASSLARILCGGYDSSNAFGVGNNQRVIFVATNTNPFTLSNGGSGTVGEYSEWDNISVREINPLSVSIAMMGELDYADEGGFNTAIHMMWRESAGNEIQFNLSTNSTETGSIYIYQDNASVRDQIKFTNSYVSGLSVPFNIAGRHGSTFINGAVDGTALTANTTPVALPDLSTTNLNLAYDFNGTISEFRIWDRDIGDTGIAEATKPSLEPSLSLTFDGQPSSFTNGGLTV